MTMMQRVAGTEPTSDQDLAAWGVNDVAYVKTVTTDDGSTGHAIHAADGTHMATMSDRDVAFAAVRQNNMEPVSVH